MNIRAGWNVNIFQCLVAMHDTYIRSHIWNTKQTPVSSKRKLANIMLWAINTYNLNSQMKNKLTSMPTQRVKIPSEPCVGVYQQFLIMFSPLLKTRDVIIRSSYQSVYYEQVNPDEYSLTPNKPLCVVL